MFDVSSQFLQNTGNKIDKIIPEGIPWLNNFPGVFLAVWEYSQSGKYADRGTHLDQGGRVYVPQSRYT